MRIAVLVVASLTLAYSFYLFYRERQRSAGLHSYGFSLIPAMWVVLLAIIIPSAYFEYQWQNTTKTLQTVAQDVTDRDDVKVHCQRAGATMIFAGAQAGHVMWEEGDERGTGSEIWLTYEICSQLRKWLHTGKDGVTVDDATALHVFSHEAAHVQGYRDETETECYALQQDVVVFTKLGTDNSTAEQLKNIYFEQVHPYLPSEYTQGC